MTVPIDAVYEPDEDEVPENLVIWREQICRICGNSDQTVIEDDWALICLRCRWAFDRWGDVITRPDPDLDRPPVIRVPWSRRIALRLVGAAFAIEHRLRRHRR